MSKSESHIIISGDRLLTSPL